MKTDWDFYYSKSFIVTKFTRKNTAKLLLKLLDDYVEKIEKKRIVELGGANSCFYEPIRSELKPKHFHVIDNNAVGLMKFMERASGDERASYENSDVLDLDGNDSFDISFSIGLIEHFDQENTARAIKTHFDLLKKDGITIISFPTPTLMYRTARKISKIVGIWFFHDERPLEFDEVVQEVRKHGEILHKRINWKAILTQGFIVARK